MVEREGWGWPQGLNLSLLKLGLGGLPSQELFSAGAGKKEEKRRQPPPSLGTPAEGGWQLVVLVSISIAVNRAFSSSSWSPGSF